MAESKPLEGEETHIVQIGVVVKDIERTIEFLTGLGLGPFKVMINDHPTGQVRGKKAYWRSKIALSQQGPVELELIEFQKGTSIQKEFLDEKGEGIHHILFRVKDIHATLEKFSEKGIHLIQEDFARKGGYLDTSAVGGIVFEVFQK
ncbi:MAG: VOC family protein [Deltaproteobacteria bacterium]|nr:VOC family protein [Deltaproteobacteria bacterium]